MGVSAEDTLGACAGRVGFYFSLEADPVSKVSIWRAIRASGPDDIVRIDVTPEGDLSAEWVYNNVLEATCASTALNLQADTSYFVELTFNCLTDRLELLVDGASICSSTGTMTSPDVGGWQTFAAGRVGRGGSPIIIDNMMISSDEHRAFYPIRDLPSAPAGACSAAP